MNQNKVSQLFKALLLSAAVFVVPINSANALLLAVSAPPPAPVPTPAPVVTPAPTPVPAASGAGLVHHGLTDVHDRHSGFGMKEGRHYGNDGD